MLHSPTFMERREERRNVVRRGVRFVERPFFFLGDALAASQQSLP